MKVIGIAEDLGKLKQAAKDRGIDLVKQVYDTAHPVAQRVALLTVASELEKVSKEGRQPDVARLQNVGSALRETLKQPDPPPEVWPAISSFVTVRSAAMEYKSNPSTLESCWKQIHTHAPVNPPGDPRSVQLGYRYDVSNCTLDLNELDPAERLIAFERPFDVQPGQSFRIAINIFWGRLVLDPSKPSVRLTVACSNCSAEVKATQGVPDRNNQLL